MSNLSVNKVEIRNKKFFDLTANVEKTLVFDNPIQAITIINMGVSNVYFTANNLASINGEECNILDKNLKGYEKYETTPFTEISFIADADCKIQILNIR